MGETASERMVENRAQADVSVVLLGAGRVATHLAPALVRAGYRVVQVWSRTETSARRLAAPLGIAFTDSLDAVVTDADIYV